MEQARSYLLNDYQRLMLKFSEFEPYNAVHFLKCPTNLNSEALKKNVNNFFKSLNIGKPMFQANETLVAFQAFKSEDFILAEKNLSVLNHALNELNYPFEKTEFPIRLFIVREPQTNTNYISITYNHWVADAFAVSQLMMNLIAPREQALNIKNLRLPHATEKLSTLFKKKLTIVNRIYSLSKNTYRFAKAFRPPQNPNSQSLTMASCTLLTASTLNKLIALSKQYNVTLNDIFVAALAKLFGQQYADNRKHIKRKWYKFKRDQIIISIICNLRPYSIRPSTQLFNLMLGFFNISFKSPEQKTFIELMKIANAASRQAKQKQQFYKNTTLFNVQSWFWQRTKDKYRLFLKNSPITIGISNMNLGKQPYLSEQDHYLRFSPASAICPLVLNITTLNQTVAVSFTGSAKRANQMDLNAIQNHFIAIINALVNEFDNL